MKKDYMKPAIHVVEVKVQTQILQSSLSIDRSKTVDDEEDVW